MISLEDGSDADSSSVTPPALESGETLLWTGRPDSRRLFSRMDWFLIPWTLLGLSFALAWEFELLQSTGLHDPRAGGIDLVAPYVSIPFILFCLYVLGPRLWVQRAIRRRTRFFITSRRTFILVNFLGYHRREQEHAQTREVLVNVAKDGRGEFRFRPARRRLRFQDLVLEDVSPVLETVKKLMAESSLKFRFLKLDSAGGSTAILPDDSTAVSSGDSTGGVPK